MAHESDLERGLKRIDADTADRDVDTFLGTADGVHHPNDDDMEAMLSRETVDSEFSGLAHLVHTAIQRTLPDILGAAIREADKEGLPIHEALVHCAGEAIVDALAFEAKMQSIRDVAGG